MPREIFEKHLKFENASSGTNTIKLITGLTLIETLFFLRNENQSRLCTLNKRTEIRNFIF